MVGLDIDLSGLVEDCERMAADTQTAVAGGTLRAGQVVFQEDKRQANQQIYGGTNPIPTRGQVAEHNVTQPRRPIGRNRIGAADPSYSGNGNLPAWPRDGSLLQDEQIRVESAGDEHKVVIDSANEPKARGRHALGTEERMPANPALGIIRHAEWRKDTVAITEPAVIPAFEDGVREVLKI